MFYFESTCGQIEQKHGRKSNDQTYLMAKPPLEEEVWTIVSATRRIITFKPQRMSSAGKIMEIRPSIAIPGGEIEILSEGFDAVSNDFGCLIGEKSARVVAASSKRILAVVPEGVSGNTPVVLECGGQQSESSDITVGRLLADELHMVANPAVDPADGAIVATRSGSRGYQLPNTLYRIETDGYIDELPVEVMNPTGIAFSPDGALFVTNRASGEVLTIERGETAIPFASGLGIATGIAFDSDGVLYVGDRAGSIHRIAELGLPDVFARLEPSVAAYHMAFGPDGRLYVTAPGLASFDAIYAVDTDGGIERFVRGFGRPQGLAFDMEGNLYVAACRAGRRGIFRITPAGEINHIVSGAGVVGLCFTQTGDLIVATNDAVFSIGAGIHGRLLG